MLVLLSFDRRVFRLAGWSMKFRSCFLRIRGRTRVARVYGHSHSQADHNLGQPSVSVKNRWMARDGACESSRLWEGAAVVGGKRKSGRIPKTISNAQGAVKPFGRGRAYAGSRRIVVSNVTFNPAGDLHMSAFGLKLVGFDATLSPHALSCDVLMLPVRVNVVAAPTLLPMTSFTQISTFFDEAFT